MSNGGLPAGRVPDTGSGRKHRLNAAMNSLNKSMSLRSDGDGPEEGSGGVRGEADGGRGDPLLMNDVRSVRRAALTVMSPLVYTWLIISGAAAIFLLLLLAVTLRILTLPYAIVLLPLWLAHAALFVCHFLSARALSRFITRANANRQRLDVADHLDRTEYLPLLQRALKFGLKTAALSTCVLIFEIVMYMKMRSYEDDSNDGDTITLGSALVPIWPIILGLLIDGILCKTQHLLRVAVWVFICASMVLATLKVDYAATFVSWGLVILPLEGVLLICASSLGYIVYGHRIGYFRLTSAQLMAGWLYSASVILAILLLGFIVEMDRRGRQGNVTTDFWEWPHAIRLLLLTAGPMSVSLFGVGAWAVAKDEFNRLMALGGQAAVIPMKLRLEPNGWTSVQSVGVAMIPMFGEVSFEPLDSTKSDIEMCGSCCACYPYDDETEVLETTASTPTTGRLA